MWDDLDPSIHERIDGANSVMVVEIFFRADLRLCSPRCRMVSVRLPLAGVTKAVVRGFMTWEVR